ncbi:MAG: hypothetical protein NC293_01580 [Roseburia sp.]|nr:hypothetical protein [Roseburia sp.]
MKAKKVLLCIGCSLLMLTACGGEYAGLTEGDVISGSAVSGSAVSGGAVSEGAVNDKVAEPDAVSGSAVENAKEAKQDMSSHRFCTDTNLYYVSEDEQKLMQARLDGTHRKCIKELPAKKNDENCVEVLYVDADWLYYDVTLFDVDEEITYRAPIKKDATGQDVVDFSKEEEIAKEILIYPLYIDSDYYFYHWISATVRQGEIVKYDLKNKREVAQMDEPYGSIIRLNDHYIMLGSDAIYIQELDSASWSKLSDYIEDCDDPEDTVVCNAEAVFYPRYLTEKQEDLRFEIIRYDGDQERKFVTWEQLDRAAKKAAGVKKLDVCMPDEMFFQGDRLYIQMQTGWMEGKTYHMEYMIFSQGEKGDGSGLRYEKELTECMKSYVKEQPGKWTDSTEVDVADMVVNDAQCIAMIEGKAYLSLFDYGKDKGRLGCYDLDTGELEWLGKKDAAFYKLGYDCGDPFHFYGGVFDPYGDNEYVNVWKWWPSQDKYEDGFFVQMEEK